MTSHNTPVMGSPSEPDPVIMAPMMYTTPAFWRWALGLWAVVALAAVALASQLYYGLGVTNLNRPVYWGLYITNFVFFVGISYGGVLTSAILRLISAEWRRPITRMAEVVAVMALLMGVANIILDLGRPDRALLILLHPHFASPLLWDVFAISLYFVVSSVYLYLPLIPDAALMRDRTTGWRHHLYRWLALGWTGKPRHWHLLELVIGLMAVAIIPIAVSVHTVVGYVFSMTIQPMWHSALFGPYFVMGAVFSGVAGLIIVMAAVRKAYHLEGYLTPLHFNNLGLLLFVVSCVWFYFTFSEYLTTFYGQEPHEMAVFNAKVFGAFAVHTWVMFICCFIVPFILLVNSRTRTVAGTVVASVAICTGMWLERYTIVVPSLLNPRAPIHRAAYSPSWTELTMFAGCLATFTLLYMTFTKLFPIISIWELTPETSPAPSGNNPDGDAIARALASGGHSTRTVPGLARTTLGIALILAAVPGRVWAQAPAPGRGDINLSIELPDNPTIGARLFVSKGCVRCHALTGEASRVGPDLGRLHFRGSVLDLAGSFWNHAPAMRERMLDMKVLPPTLTSQEMADLVAFLTAYRYYLTEVGQAANPTVGKVVFAEKGCGRCHGTGHDFGKSAPDLTQYRGRFSAISLAQTMWNHGGEMSADMRRQGVAWPKFQETQMGDLLAFLQTGARGSTEERAYLEPGSPRRGRELFTSKRCIDCHAVAGVGGKRGPALGSGGREFAGSISALAGLMWNHSQGMSAELSRQSLAVTFSGQEMADILAYVYFVNYASVPANPERGGRIFANKCAPCHSVNAGERVGPDLGVSTALNEPIAVMAAMWDHAPKMERELRTRGLPWPRLEPGEAADLTAYLLSRRSGSSAPTPPTAPR